LTLHNSTESYVDVFVNFSMESKAAQRVSARLAPSLWYCFQPSEMGGTPGPLVVTSFHVGYCNSKTKLIKLEELHTVDSAGSAMFVVRESGGHGELSVFPADSEMPLNQKAPVGSTFSSLVLDNKSNSQVTVTLSPSTHSPNVIANRQTHSFEIPARVEAIMLRSSAPTPLIHIILGSDSNGARSATYVAEGRGGVGLTLRAPEVIITKVAASKGSGKDKLDRRKGSGGGMLDAFIDKPIAAEPDVAAMAADQQTVGVSMFSIRR
jgi:hypothetical protein